MSSTRGTGVGDRRDGLGQQYRHQRRQQQQQNKRIGDVPAGADLPEKQQQAPQEGPLDPSAQGYQADQ